MSSGVLDMALDDVISQNRKQRRPNNDLRRKAGSSNRAGKGRSGARSSPYNGARPMRNNTLSNRNVRPATTTRSSNNTLTVANLHFNVTEKDLYDLFGQIGPLKRAFLHIAPNGKSSGVADVVFVHGKDAERARNTYNNVELDGRPMRITFANVVASAPVSLNNNNNNNNTGRRTNLRGGNTRGRGGPRRRDNRPKPSEDQLDADMDSYMNNSEDTPMN